MPTKNGNQDCKMDDATCQRIVKDPLVRKFCFYGFFKNLRFFEPYLLLIFLAWGVNLFQIGLLVMVQQVFTYIFEVPSGMWADKYGKKTVTMLCFVLYIVSFVFYFLGPNYWILVVASAFFGLGEAFRSGTHKAMILKWLEKEGLFQYKAFVYGRTRSYSLVGSALNAVLAIVFMLNIPANRWIFPVTIVPYIVDFALVATYPKYMNEHAPVEGSAWSEMGKTFRALKESLADKRLRKLLFSSASYDGIFKSLKDYIQPIMLLFVGILLVNFHAGGSDEEAFMTVFMGVTYALFYVISSYSSKNAYKVRARYDTPKKPVDLLYYAFAGALLGTALFMALNFPLGILVLYLAIYVMTNMRRPLVVDYLGDLMDKEQRATLLSVESLLKSLTILVAAPLFGYVAEYFSIQTLFFLLPLFMLALNHFAFSRD
ncbi:MAG: MFS transporter [Promethearchaeota archaeon]